jgi:Protein of unknown function (DUF642)
VSRGTVRFPTLQLVVALIGFSLMLASVGAPPAHAASQVDRMTVVATPLKAKNSSGQSTFAVLSSVKFDSAPLSANVTFDVVQGPATIQGGHPTVPNAASTRGTASGTCYGAGPVVIRASWNDGSIVTDFAEGGLECDGAVEMLWGGPKKEQLGKIGAAIGLGVAILGIGVALAGGPFGWTVLAAVIGAGGAAASLAAADPPDPDYRRDVVLTTSDHRSLGASDGMPPDALPVLNRLMDAWWRVRQSSLALQQTQDRWMGAGLANDAAWQERHARAALGFAHQLAQDLRAVATVLDTLPADLTSAGVPDVLFTDNELETIVDTWAQPPGPAEPAASVFDEAGWSDPIPGYPDATIAEWVAVSAAEVDPADRPKSLYQALTIAHDDLRSTADGLDGWGPPVVTGASAMEGPEEGGTVVTLTGDRLNQTQNVYVGPNVVDQLNCDASHCQLTTPPGAGVEEIVAVNGDGEELPALHAVTFRYRSPADSAVINGSFEGGGGFPGIQNFQPIQPGNYGSWEVRGNRVDVVGPLQATAGAGRQFVDLNGNHDDLDQSGPGAIRQTLATTPGHSYTFEFLMSGNPNGEPVIKSLQAAFGDANAEFSFDTADRSNDALGWQRKALTATACSAQTTIELRSLTPGYRGPNVDSVRVHDNGLATLPCQATAAPLPVPRVREQTIKAPKKLRMGKRVRLAKLTRQGAVITWSHRSKSKSVCRVSGKRGKQVVKGKRRGTCGLVAKAPAVSGYSALRGVIRFKVVSKRRR